LNEERVKQLGDIEIKAKKLHDDAVQEAQLLPKRAEVEARELLETTRSAAQEEARQFIAEAQNQSNNERVLKQAEEEAKRKETLAMTHFDRAVNYVLHRIAGRQS
jgi:vacuolar-type H+-ATPase subunit H